MPAVACSGRAVSHRAGSSAVPARVQGRSRPPMPATATGWSRTPSGRRCHRRPHRLRRRHQQEQTHRRHLRTSPIRELVDRRSSRRRSCRGAQHYKPAEVPPAVGIERTPIAGGQAVIPTSARLTARAAPAAPTLKCRTQEAPACGRPMHRAARTARRPGVPGALRPRRRPRQPASGRPADHRPGGRWRRWHSARRSSSDVEGEPAVTLEHHAGDRRPPAQLPGGDRARRAAQGGCGCRGTARPDSVPPATWT